MRGLRQKALTKCECGKTVAAGSVFCPSCRAEVNRRNVITMQKEERNCQKSMQSKGKRRKG